MTSFHLSGFKKDNMNFFEFSSITFDPSSIIYILMKRITFNRSNTHFVVFHHFNLKIVPGQVAVEPQIKRLSLSLSLRMSKIRALPTKSR